MDDVRKNDWFPRSVYRNARMVSEAIRIVENRLQRNAKDHEIAKELEMKLEDYQKLLADVNLGQLYSLEDYGLDSEPLQPSGSEDEDPFIQVENKEFYERLAQKIEQLPERERMVMSLYYDQEFNLKDIGQVLEVSESWVCQIHSQAQLRLRSKLSDWKD